MEMYCIIVGLLAGFLFTVMISLVFNKDKKPWEHSDMKCPKCNGEARAVSVHRPTPVNHVLRYRKCAKCNYRFYTMEVETRGGK